MSVDWYNSELLTDPQEFEIGRTEQEPHAWDVSLRLDDGESATSPSVTVWLMRSGVGIAEVEDVVSEVAVVGDASIVATLDGSKLTEGKIYRVLVTFTAGPGKVTSCATMLRAVA